MCSVGKLYIMNSNIPGTGTNKKCYLKKRLGLNIE